MAKAPKFDQVLYMVIDVTTVETTALLKIVPLREATLWGQLYKGEGRKVIAPPMEGRGFSKLEKLQLQYFYWNVCNETPPEDYAELVKRCLSKLASMEVDKTSLTFLESEVRRLYPEIADGTNVAGTKPEPKAEKVPRAANEPYARPKTTSTTGAVWNICDELFAKNGNTIPDRKTTIAACEADGINPATASTQYGKWKASKLASQTA